MLLDGAENWDWNDMELDFLTPKKPICGKSPIKVSLSLEHDSRAELGTRKRPLANRFLSSGLLV
jgi:hypothetical protein